jgi:hypothetical protein
VLVVDSTACCAFSAGGWAARVPALLLWWQVVPLTLSNTSTAVTVALEGGVQAGQWHRVSVRFRSAPACPLGSGFDAVKDAAWFQYDAAPGVAIVVRGPTNTSSVMAEFGASLRPRLCACGCRQRLHDL